MTARILCPGPSLALCDPAGFVGMTLAVNRAAIRFPAEIWVACDYGMINAVSAEIAGRPLLFTTHDSARRLWPTWKGKLTEFESLRGGLPKGVPARWTAYSFTAAIAYAVIHGATQIDCYGADWDGEAEFDGAAPVIGTRRDGDRWRDERRLFGEMTAALPGVTVARIPAGALQI